MRGLFMCLLALSCAPAAACEMASEKHVVPLVELYTADGCSDCPPADKWLSSLAADTPPSQASALAFHVDYWDDQGWPDPYADPAHGERQRYRVNLAKKKVLYTPHVMIGRETTVDWRDPGEVRRLLSRARSTTADLGLGLQVARSDAGLDVEVRATRRGEAAADAGRPDMMWLAFYQDGLVSHVLEGENKGKTLHHDRVIRVLLGPWAVQDREVRGKVGIPLPAGVDLSVHGLVLFAESSATGAGLQSLSLPLDACAL